MSKQYQIGRFNLLLPDDHNLDRYQANWRLYDRALEDISRAVFQHHRNSTAIDIGANVGDSAALIQAHQVVPTLCVEGNPEYFEYLTHNASVIGNIEIADCFVGQQDQVVNLELMTSRNGTASIVNAVGSDGILTTNMQSLEVLLSYFPDFKDAKLLKIDTDGFDFDIILQSENVLAKLLPIVYFEYDISFNKKGVKTALRTIELLINLGYTRFIIYDNFGNPIMSLSETDQQRFIEITNYLVSNLYRSGQPAVYYFDVAAFHRTDESVFEAIYKPLISIDYMFSKTTIS